MANTPKPNSPPGIKRNVACLSGLYLSPPSRCCARTSVRERSASPVASLPQAWQSCALVCHGRGWHKLRPDLRPKTAQFRRTQYTEAAIAAPNPISRKHPIRSWMSATGSADKIVPSAIAGVFIVAVSLPFSIMEQEDAQALLDTNLLCLLHCMTKAHPARHRLSNNRLGSTSRATVNCAKLSGPERHTVSTTLASDQSRSRL